MEKQKKEKYELKKEFMETTSDEVMTIQNDAYSIKDLLDKFTSGVLQPKQLLRSGFVENDFNPEIMDGENPEFIDRTDVEQYVSSVQRAVKKATSKKDEPNSGNVVISDKGDDVKKSTFEATKPTE